MYTIHENTNIYANHQNDVMMSTMASQIISLAIVYSIICLGVYQRKHQSSASLAFVRGIQRWPVNSPHKWSVTRKLFPFDDVIMIRHPICLSPFGLLHWHWANYTVAPVPVKHPRRIWVNGSMNPAGTQNITTTKQRTTKPHALFMDIIYIFAHINQDRKSPLLGRHARLYGHSIGDASHDVRAGFRLFIRLNWLVPHENGRMMANNM